MENSYTKNSSVLVKHGDSYYEAKIIDVDTDEESKESIYYVHYKGWSSKWDEWVTSILIAPLNTTKEGLENENCILYSKKGANSENVTKNTITQKKISTAFPVKEDPQIPSLLPEKLRRYLLSDWHCVEIQSKWIPFPRVPSIVTILNDFQSSLPSDSYITSEQVKVVCNSLIEYFEKFLASNLLYGCEINRLRMNKTKIEDMKYSNVFGAEHLLRLLYQYPFLVYHTDASEEDVRIICDVLTMFHKYLEEHTELFLQPSDYVADAPSV